MARRKRAGAPSVSLFPFLSILACVIGTLTLMITALALGQMDSPTVEFAQQHEGATQRLAQDSQAIDALNKKIQRAQFEADRQDSALASLRQQLEELKGQIENEKDKKPAPPQVPPVDKAGHQKRLAELRGEIKVLETGIRELENKLKQRAAPPEAAVVQIKPGGSGTNLNPSFVECAAGRILILEDDRRHAVRNADMASDKKFQELLQRVSESDKDTVVFLVRDDGLGTYYAARKLALAKFARNGKLPVIGQGKIDLSLFDR